VVIACDGDASDGIDVSGTATCGPLDDISLVDIRGCVIPGIGVTTVVATPRVTDSCVSSSAIAETGVLGCHTDPCDAAVAVMPMPHGCSCGVVVVTAALAWLACPSGATVTVTPGWLSSSFFVSAAVAFACVCSPKEINAAAASSWDCCPLDVDGTAALAWFRRSCDVGTTATPLLGSRSSCVVVGTTFDLPDLNILDILYSPDSEIRVTI
jgi:hypothetical protein